MSMIPERDERRFIIPEVVQTSAMDCGPASLKSLLEGYSISVSYGRLREACQTSVDGTSIDAMEDVANQLGLEAEQIMLPADHLFLSSSHALPAIVVVRLANGLTHFVVIWRVHGKFLQVMDPGSGRRWPTLNQFLDDVYIHDFPVPAEAWREWAAGEGFLEPLDQRLINLQIEKTRRSGLIQAAVDQPGWQALAALDAAVRMTDTLVRARGVERGQEAARILDHFRERGLRQLLDSEGGAQGGAEGGTPSDAQAAPVAPQEIPVRATIPQPYWSVRPYPADAEGQAMVSMHGAVLVRAFGKRSLSAETFPGVDTGTPEEESPAVQPLSPELVAALKEAPINPLGEMWNSLRQDGLLSPFLIVFALSISSVGVLLEAFLLQGLMQVSGFFPFLGERTLAVGMFFAFFVLMAGLELPLTASILRTGRRLETRLRLAFLEKLPRLSDQYFHSRLVSDMTQRAHELRILRMLPEMGVALLRTFFQIILTTIGIIWIDPISAPLAILATCFFIALTLVAKPFMDERDLRVHVHLGALDRFYLDAMQGLIPIRSHGAERALRREHENLLVEWVKASLDSLQLGRILNAVSSVSYSLFAVWIVFHYVAQGGEAGGILLLFYWTLNLPALGQNLVLQMQQYPMYRNTILRVLEPIKAPDEAEQNAAPFSVETTPNIPAGEGTAVGEAASVPAEARIPDHPAAVAIRLEDVEVKAGGHTILSEVNAEIRPGEHVAIVGPSGAGKSSLVGLLLGWYRAESGRISIDERPLTGSVVQELRQVTAWVDPAVQLWNRTLLYNLQYGNPSQNPASLQDAIAEADLFETLARFPDGLQTTLGESGGLVSGGEGQRVRLARAMMRPQARLVILDEPFRGLDREKRRTLLQSARRHWQAATLLCVTHDVGETQAFPRVLVIADGKIIEDDTPAALCANPQSRYLALLKAEEEVRVKLWENPGWQRLWIEEGRLKKQD